MNYFGLSRKDLAAIISDLGGDQWNQDRISQLTTRQRVVISAAGSIGPENVSYDEIADAARRIDALITERLNESDKDLVEGQAAVDLVAAFDVLPVEVIDDERFWNFVAIEYFWRFILWREEGAKDVLVYFDSGSGADSIPLRLFLRAKAIEGPGGEMNLVEIREATDFWRSHILRVRTGRARRLARAMAGVQKDDDLRMSTKVLREFAKRVNRLWSNVVLYELDDDEALRLVREIREEALEVARRSD